MEKSTASVRNAPKNEVWIGNELIRNAPRDPKAIALLIKERRSKKPAQKVRDKIKADLQARGEKV